MAESDRPQLEKEFRESAERWEAASVDSLVRSVELGTLDFGMIRGRFEDVKEMVSLLNSPEQLPREMLRLALHALAKLNQRADNVAQFTLMVGDPTSQRNALGSQFAEETKEFAQAVMPIIGYLAAKRMQADWSVSSRRTLQQLQEADSSLQAMTAKLAEMDTVLQAAREAAGKTGVEVHSKFFRDQAAEHQKWSRGWLIGAGVLAAAAGVLAVVNYLHVTTPQATPDGNVQVVLAKVIAFSLLFSSIVWCAKIYRAQRHNYVINRHRQNALSSFQTFVAATGDDLQTKNAVLLQATQSIFAQQASGYIAHEGDAAGPAQLVEFVRTVTQPPKPGAG